MDVRRVLASRVCALSLSLSLSLILSDDVSGDAFCIVFRVDIIVTPYTYVSVSSCVNRSMNGWMDGWMDGYLDMT